MGHKILAVNPGSTSTKIALYEDEILVFFEQADHTDEELSGFSDILDQLDFRLGVIRSVLQKHQTEMNTLSAVVGRGGLLPPVNAGGYLVNEKLKNTILSGNLSPHASNLGALLADELASPLHIPAYIYDSVSSHEFREIAMITGVPEFQRHSQCHVLNSKAMGRKVAEKHGKRYEDLNLIVAHLGGGISLSLHEKGRIIDAIGDDAGPFSPERTGGLPLLYVVELCYSGQFTKREMIRKIRGMGGIKAHLGTHDCRLVEKMIADGDEKARLIYEAEAYQIAKGIGELAPAINGRIDYIVLTGGLAHSEMMTRMVTDRVKFIAPVEIMPGEVEMEALAFGVLRILRGQELPSIYSEENKKINDVEAYIGQFTPELQTKLQTLRDAIRTAAPNASEKISWGMPTFVQNGNLVHFAAHKNHIGLYPGPEAIEVFQDRLTAYRSSKGAIQFPIHAPLPFDLIQEIVRYRAAANTK